MNEFFRKIEERWQAGKKVCIGLDPDKRKMTSEQLDSKKSSSPIYELNCKIIEATKDQALCYKPNRAFYRGPDGLSALRNTVAHIRCVAPEVPVIYDAKFGDIGNTNDGYVEEAFDWLKADAVTVHCYMGMEAMKPFLERKDKGVIVLCRTSNPDAGEFQERLVYPKRHEAKRWRIDPLSSIWMYELVAYRVSREWDYNGNCSLVVGATAPHELSRVRAIVGDMPLLIPGIGAQGGDIRAVVQAGANSKKSGMIINSSSGIMFSPDPRETTRKLTDEINASLEKVSVP